MNKPFSRELEDRFFEGSNEMELNQHGVQKSGISCVPVGLFGANFNPRF